ncbi:putative transposable element [Trichonephila clavipes]|nr:putative transposable element [Trichonephila clavipes]
MPGKRARKHFSQLSEFERDLIIRMKTAGWSTRRVVARWIVLSMPLEIVGSSGHKKVPTRGKPGLEHLAEANLKSKRPFRALHLTPEHRQLRLQWCQARSMWNVTDWQKVVFSDESRFVLGQMITVDEAHFWLNGYVNKQNCHIWSEANPQVYVETPLHPEKLTVWGALWAGGIIGPYFFKNNEGHNVPVNGDRYRAMITNFFIPELNNHDVQELWFQQDGATCHTARATIDLLKDKFGDRLISRFGPVNWPPRSCDLTPLDYFLCGYVKSLVYAGKAQTLDHLEDNIRRVIADIRPQMLEKVIENWTSRLDYIRASRGSPMPEIIFKM